jgi:hypothetical protein
MRLWEIVEEPYGNPVAVLSSDSPALGVGSVQRELKLRAQMAVVYIPRIKFR